MAAGSTNETKAEDKPERNVDRIKNAVAEIRETLLAVIPASLKGEADRLLHRAVLTFSRGSVKLQSCTIKSFVQCIVDAAEVGLAIDGKLGYPVPYNCKVVDKNNVERWEMQAKFIPSYIGLYMVARRSGQVKHCAADLVYTNDSFVVGRDGPRVFLEHRPPAFGEERGKLLGAYSVIEFPDGDWTYATMTVAELELIRARSKAANDGPWVTDRNEMYKKTVLRRGLKLYCSDPGFVLAIQHDDEDFEDRGGEADDPRVVDEPAKARSVHRLPPPVGKTPLEQEFDDLLSRGSEGGAGGGEPAKEPVEGTKAKRGRPKKAQQQAEPEPEPAPEAAGSEGSQEAAGAQDDHKARLVDLKGQVAKLAGEGDAAGILALHDRECGPDATMDLLSVEAFDGYCGRVLRSMAEGSVGE